MSTDIKLSKTHISKIIQSGGFLSSLLSKLPGPLMKAALPLAENILDPLGIRAAALAIDTGIQDKIHDSGTTTLIISNEEMNDIMKIVQALEDSNILLKGITKAIENEKREQIEGFLGMLLATLGASLLKKNVNKKRNITNWLRRYVRKRILRAGEGNKMNF